MGGGPIEEAMNRFRRDAARWVRPEQIAHPSEVTPAVVARQTIRFYRRVLSGGAGGDRR